MLGRDKDILQSLNDLDLSPTMEKNAREKYSALCDYLSEQGVDSDFQPQGSFLIGTAIKPYRNGENQDYDLDILAILNRKKEETTPYKVKNDIGDVIKNSGIYSEKLEREDRNCWTLKYAEVSKGVGFSLDVVPAVDEEVFIKDEITRYGVDFFKTRKTVAITDKQENYTWMTTNPLGFGDWFLEISNKHLSDESRSSQYYNLPYDIRMKYASIEEIPTFYYRSNLQRAVQFIKRHRDIYYDRMNSRDEKPSSILISCLVADSVKNKCYLSISEIIKNFVDGYMNRSISIMDNGRVYNPVDPRENLIEGYSLKKLKRMDTWIDSLKNMIFLSEDIEFRKAVHNDINTLVFTDSFGNIKKIEEPSKPWMKLDE